ncbi:MAG: DUF4935 domain-containing protein [Eubacterium sp.]|nr:DUF4935 domain-containing protein [Clostridiales bacterium]MBR6404004.1 DUF4935 domain-containing protein [Eubacterium sp.]
MLDDVALKSNKDAPSIQSLISGSTYIVFDTNVLLNIYHYSPEFTEFAMDCLNQIKGTIMLPSTVRIEYGKHCDREYHAMKNRIERFGESILKSTTASSAKMLNICDDLEKMQFPDIDVLKAEITQKLDEIKKAVETYKSNHNDLKLIAEWSDNDHLKQLVSKLDVNQIMDSPDYETLYSWYESGEKRFASKMPPGYKDDDKPGVSRYSDLVLWLETIRYAKNKNVNIIFVTDDVKGDWWQTNSDGSICFRNELIEEFCKETSQKIYPYTSAEFYTFISDTFEIERVPAVEYALNKTDNDYCINVQEEVFDSIITELSYSGSDYLDVDPFTLGTEGIDEFEVIDYSFDSATRIDRDNNIVTYQFEYTVTLDGTSFDYWGRDEDTKEVILSPGIYHKYEGAITVEVKRECASFIDFESDRSFKEAKIIEGKLKEIESKDLNISD